MNKLDMSKILWEKNGFVTEVTDAPKHASTFDKMLIVFSDRKNKVIRRIMFFSTRENKIIAEY